MRVNPAFKLVGVSVGCKSSLEGMRRGKNGFEEYGQVIPAEISLSLHLGREREGGEDGEKVCGTVCRIFGRTNPCVCRKVQNGDYRLSSCAALADALVSSPAFKVKS